MTDEQKTDPRMYFIDGRDALACVFIRPNPNGSGVIIETHAKGISHLKAATCLREVADMWDPPKVDGPKIDALTPEEFDRAAHRLVTYTKDLDALLGYAESMVAHGTGDPGTARLFKRAIELRDAGHH